MFTNVYNQGLVKLSNVQFHHQGLVKLSNVQFHHQGLVMFANIYYQKFGNAVKLLVLTKQYILSSISAKPKSMETVSR